MKRVRILLLWLIGLVVVVAALAVGAFYLTPSSLVARYAAAKVRAETGRELTISGPIKRTLYPVIGFETGPISISNADWAGPAPLFSAQSVSVGVAIAPLFDGRLVVESVRLAQPTATLDVDPSGLTNYDFYGVENGETSAAADEDAASADLEKALDLAIEDAEIVDGVLVYSDRRSGRDIHLTGVAGRLAYPGATLPLTVTGEAVVNGRGARLAGVFDNLAAVLQGESLRADFTFEADGALVDFDGTVLLGTEEALHEARGAVAFQLSEDPELTAWLRSALPPRLDLIGAVDVAGEMTAVPERLDLSLGGYLDYNTVRTKVSATAVASEGWLRGETVADVETSAVNDYFDVGYAGKVGRTPEGGLFVEGAYRAKIADGDAFGRWIVDPKSTDDVTLLESFNLTGDVALLADQASASFDGVVDYNQRRIAAHGELSGGADWRRGGEVDTFFEMQTPELADLSWSGDLVFAGAGPHLTGDLTLATLDLAALRNWIDGRSIPAYYRRFVLQSRLVGDPTRLRLESAVVQLNDMEARAEIEAEWRETRPLVRAEIMGGPLDMTPFISGEAFGAAPRAADAPPEPEWSDAPFELAALHMVDADILVDIDGFRAAPLAFGPTRMRAALVQGRIEAEVEEMALYGGEVSGQAAFDARSPEAALTGSARGTAVGMGSLLTAFGQPNLLYGDANFDVAIAGEGRDLRALMESLSGRGGGEIRDGKLLVINFAAQSLEFEASLLGARQEVPGETPFEELSATATMDGGVARNRDMRLTGPVISARGEGDIDLGRKRLDYVVTPTRFGEISFLGIDRLIGSAFPVEISGPFHAPVVGADKDKPLDDVVERSRKRDRD